MAAPYPGEQRCADCLAPNEYCSCGTDDYDDDACMTCGGEGFVEGRDIDTGDFWYDPYDLYACPNCLGTRLAKDQRYW